MIHSQQIIPEHALFAELHMSQATYNLVVTVMEKLKFKRPRKSASTRDMGDASAPQTKRHVPGANSWSSQPAPIINGHSMQTRTGTQRSFGSEGNLEERLQRAAASLTQNIKDNRGGPQYHDLRRDLLLQEANESWDADARSRATQAELDAQEILVRIREDERRDPALFGELPSEAIPHPHSRDMGGRFLVNKERIKRSRIFQAASMMPKGAHLHLHFNSEIQPELLFPLARSPEVQDTMFIRSTQPLTSAQAFTDTEIVFNVFPKDTPSADIFSPAYNPDAKDPHNCPWMLWRQFRQVFPEIHAPKDDGFQLDAAERWARQKMVVTVENAYGQTATHNSSWACFNQGTRAFKGLVGYEGVYRWYIGALIESMRKDRVMYAELRPMLLDKFIPSNDGLRKLDHSEQMKIICQEVKKKQDELTQMGLIDEFPFGVKIIYCTPRSIPRAKMESELADCLKLKIEFPELICGFDLVGAEDRPNCIAYYADLLVAFQETCKKEGLEIPFMFHAGETLIDTGGSADPKNSNLYDSLLLNAKRIGHGYALLKHPTLVKKYRDNKICLELCPISNELLHLCGNAREHPYPALLAAGLHCTLNADNPSLFSSSLSYEFYQVMVGDPRMTIHGWKQLAEWSLEHSCLAPEQVVQAKEIFAREWNAFCSWVVETFGEHAAGLGEVT